MLYTLAETRLIVIGEISILSSVKFYVKNGKIKFHE